MNYSPVKMEQFLERENFKLKKKFGQNFIIDENIIDGIVNKASIDKDTMVIEIGPGAGALTYKLALKSKNVLCYEIDETLKGILKNNLKQFNNVEIIYGDFLKMNVKNDLKKYQYKKLYVVANLPYYITTPILFKIITSKIKVDKIVIMVQKEVGDRFKAIPNTKEYNALSVQLNYYFDIKKIMDVTRNVFIPKPNVDSIVLELNRKEKYEVKDEEKFLCLIKDSFKQKRKNLKNNLKNYDLEKVEKILKENGYDLNIRAEQLNIEMFIKIANNL